MTILGITAMAVKVWRVRRLLEKAKRHLDASNRLGAKAARIMPEIARSNPRLSRI